MVRFGLPSSDHVLGLPLGQHILLQATIKGESVARAYTPTSSNLQKGYFELVVKVYHANTNPSFPNGGKLTQHIDKMKIGDTINVKGKLCFMLTALCLVVCSFIIHHNVYHTVNFVSVTMTI